MATYVNDLRLKEIATGDESGTWGTSTNTNLELIAEAFSFGTEAITTNADTHTTTIADGSTDPGRSIYLKYTGALDSACTITIGPNTVSKLWFIENATTDSGSSGPYNIVISQGSGANVTIPNGHVKAIYSDGAGSGAAMVDAFTDLNLAGTTTVDDLTVSDDLSVTDDATIGGTLGVTGAVTANAGVSIDNITIDGTEIDLSSGDLSIDVAGNLQIDADDNGEIRFLDGGTQYAAIKKDGNNALFQSIVADGDFVIQGIDGSSFISALTFDMSDAGAAQFNSNVGIGTAPTSTLHLKNSNRDLNFTLADSPATGDAGVQITAGASDFLGIFAGSSNGELLLGSNGTEKARINSSGSIGVGTTSPSGGSVGGKVLHLVNSGATASVRVDRSDSSTTGTISLLDANSTHGLFGTGSKPMAFSTDSTERMRIDSSGFLQIATTGKSGRINLQPNPSNNHFVEFYTTADGKVGEINTTGGTTTNYVTSSDYRLKENVDYTWDATTRLKQLKPARFNWISDETNTLVEGFLAHEVSDIVPEAISGKKDAVDGQGNPEYQGIDHSKLVPLLTKAIQELEARITALES
jgi:hypothetical protein